MTAKQARDLLQTARQHKSLDFVQKLAEHLARRVMLYYPDGSLADATAPDREETLRIEELPTYQQETAWQAMEARYDFAADVASLSDYEDDYPVPDSYAALAAGLYRLSLDKWNADVFAAMKAL